MGKEDKRLIKDYLGTVEDKLPDEGTFVVAVSTETPDRDNEVLRASGFELGNYRKNPVVLWAHDYSSPPIGKALWVKTVGDKLKAKVKFASTQFAQEIKQLYEEGFLSAWSVGFIPKKWIDGETDSEISREYTKQEMLEFSAVPVPANPDALLEAVKMVKDVNLKKMLKKQIKEQKPEDTDSAIKLSIESEENKHKGHNVRTISISEARGIKAVYCEDCKKLTTYVFNKDNWNAEDSKAWIKDYSKYKELNKKETFKPLGKIFDIEQVQTQPSTFEYALFEKFLECKTSQIFKNTYFVPSPLVGNRLYGFKHTLNEFKLKDTRNFDYGGNESPPAYEVINLSAKKSDDFLVQGTQFYDAGDIPLIFSAQPTWGGMELSLVTSMKYKQLNKALADKSFLYAKDNNLLKLEKFDLSGDFLPKSDDNWENLVLEESDKQAVMNTITRLENKGVKAKSRGMLFVGRPGTGKTKTGRVIINEVESTFIWLSSKDFRRNDVNAALVLAFDMARELAPSVLFLEDIDTWLNSYCVDLLKTELDGIRQNDGVVTILTSNFPEKLPDALLDRPGRFHHVLDFKLPNAIQRKEMIEKWAGKVGEDLLKEILEATDGYSGAHMKELVEYAQMLVEDNNKELGESILESLKRMQGQKELIEQIRDSKKDKGIESFMAKVEKETYKCECIDCGWKTESAKHCKDIKCDECGGTMRREERPGAGEESADGDKGVDESKNIVKISDSLLEFEEGKIDRKEILTRIERAMTDVMEKVGAVLSKNNKAKLVIAKENIQSILDVAEINTAEDDKAVSLEDILEAIKAEKKEKEVKKEEVKPPKKEVKNKKEVSDTEVQDIKAIIHAQAGECLDVWVGEIRKNLLGKV